MTGLASGLYLGAVTHARLKPRHHRMRYRVFMLLLDLDELGRLDGLLRLFGHRRFALTSFHEADHLDGSGRCLKAQVEAHLEAAAIAHGGPWAPRQRRRRCGLPPVGGGPRRSR